MLSAEDFLNTPSNYATPDQLASVRQYADLLTKGGQRDQQITSPWQGVRMLADALSGNVLRNQAGQQQMQGYGSAADAVSSQAPGGSPQPQQQSDSSSTGASSGAASVRNNNPGAQWPGPVAMAYGATGSQTVGGGNKIATFDDPVKGAAAQLALLDSKYTGVPLSAAVSKWSGGNDSSEYTKHIMNDTGLTPDTVITPQLLRSPQGIALAKSMANWEAGGQYPLPDEGWQKGQALAFNGTPSQGPLAMPGTPQSAAMALRGQPSTEPPVSKVGDPQMGPQFAPSRPQVTPQKLNEILRNPWVDPGLKQEFYKNYMMQNQPTSAAGPGGNWIFDHNGNKVWVGDLQKGELKAGDVSTPYMGTLGEPNGGSAGQYNPAGGVPGVRPPAPAPQGTPLNDLMNAPSPWVTPQAPVPGGAAPGAPGPQGAIAPQGAPTAAAAAMPMGQAAMAGAQASAAQATPQASPQVASQGAPPIQTAMATPEGVKSDAPPIGAGMLGAVPPIGAAPTAIPPAPQLAQAGGGLPTLNDLADFANQNKYKQELNTNNAKHYADNSNAVLAAGAQATQSLPMIDMAAQAVKDPRFYSGIFSEGALDLKKLQAAFGDDPNAAAAMEVFTKAMAGDVLSQLRSKLQGLGQVRLAEIQLINQATANMHNTPAANLAVLNIIRRSYQQTSALSQIADAYNGQANPPTNAGLESTMQKYLLTHPTFSPDEIKNFSHTLSLDGPAKPEATTYSKGTPPPAAPPASTGMDLTHPDLLPNIQQEKARRGLQ
jgi:hypothetical protein